MTADSQPVIVDQKGATANVGKLVAVQGVARDAKISAAVVTDSLVVYCLGLATWPRGMAGATVIAKGKLEQTGEFAAPLRPGGEFSAGTEGPVWVLRECRYEARPKQ